MVEELRKAARDDRDALYLNFFDGKNAPNFLTFGEVLEGAERWARGFLARKLEPGARVLLLLPTSADFVFAFFGAEMAGGVPAPCAFPVGFGSPDSYVLSLEPIAQSADPRYLVTTSALEAPARALMARLDRADAVLRVEDFAETPSGIPLREPEPEDLALLQYTSGPTAHPLGAVLTHQGALANVDGLGQVLGITRHDIGMFWVPLMHDMGLVGGLFTALYHRCQLHLMSPQTFLMHPHRWFENISTYRATLGAAPNSAYQMCVRRIRDKHMEGLDLSSWRFALNGAETVYASTVDAFVEKFAPIGFSKTAMCPIYGLAENTLVVSCAGSEGATVFQHPLDGTPVVGAGKPLPGQEVAITDDHGRVLTEGAIGEIRVRGPCVMKGYFRNEAASEASVQNEWLLTGDLGFIAENRVYLTGRRRELIIKMGRNYHPDDVEGLLEAEKIDGLRAAVAFATGNTQSCTEDLVVVAETDACADDEKKRLATEISSALLSVIGIRADQVCFVPAGTVPTGTPAPERRRQVRERWRRGDFALADS